MAAKRFLEEYGVPIARNGYEVIPIVPGEKRPYGKKWQTYDGSEEGVEDWLKADKGEYGVGIKTRFAPAVDIDILDPDLVDEIREMVFALTGETLQRVGFAPKTLLVYQVETPFQKIDTGPWSPPNDPTKFQKVEVLGDGQQFVAAHIHPDTGKPYRWLNGKSVLNTRRTDLPFITQEIAEQIKNACIQLFVDRGWKKKSSAVNRIGDSTYDPDDPFAAVKSKTEISDLELFNRLMMVPGNEDYDVWFHVGMALYHQYDGNGYGLDLWQQWSSSAPNYDEKALADKWPTFSIQQKDRQPITARFILSRAKEETTRLNREVLQQIKTGISEATTLEELKTVCDIIKETPFDMVLREMLVGAVKTQFAKLSGSPPRIGVVRNMTQYASPENKATPAWLRLWVYVQHDETFLNLKDRRQITKNAFDASHNRLMLTQAERLEGKAVPDTTAYAAAMNLFEIPIVYNRMYLPGYPALYNLNDLPYANLYNENEVPELPGEFGPAEQSAVRRVVGHVEHLIADKKARALFINYIAYIVQNPGSRINWAILLQGAEGDGKSFWGSLLKVILGPSNVNIINGKQLEEKFNGWAEGAMVCFIEEVRLHNQNRFDAINTLKPMITNPTTLIRRMNTNAYEVINTMSYIATSNHKDGLPVGDADSRFYPIFTRYQYSDAIDAFKLRNPEYYDRLFNALDYPGAIRQFFLEHKICPDFSPKSRAPLSAYRHELVHMNRSDEEDALQESLLEDEAIDFCDVLLDSGLIPDKFMDKETSLPHTKALKRLLTSNGFSYLGRYKIGKEKRQFWSRSPEAWSNDLIRRGAEIRQYLDPEDL